MTNRKGWKLFFTLYAIKIFYAITAFCYGGLFIYILFFARRRRGLTTRYLTFIPLKSTITNFLNIHGNEHHELFNYYSNLIGNILLFLPFPVFLVCLCGINSFRKIFIISFILSFSVELLQFVLKKGVADIDDILLNLLGTTIGFFIYKLLWPSKA